MPLKLTYDASVSNRQRHLIEQAVSLATYPWSLVNITATFEVVTEPSCPGHKDYMCTTETIVSGVGTATVEIRTGADDPSAPVNFLNGRRNQDDVNKFFMESIIHELGHCITFYFLTDDSLKTEAAQLFHKSGPTGTGSAAGTLADWDPLTSPWEDRIQEAVAEVFKDTYLADQHRLYENRTNWDLSASDHTNLMRLLTPAAVTGATDQYVYMRYEGAAADWMVSMDAATTIEAGGIGYRHAHFRSVQKGSSEGIPGWSPPWPDGNMVAEDNEPIKLVLSYGNEFYGHWAADVDFLSGIPPEDMTDEGCAWTHNYPTNCYTFPSANYTVTAELSDARNGKIFEFTHAVDGATPPTVGRWDIRPKYPVDIKTLVGIIDVQGYIPDYWGGAGGIESGSSDGGVRGSNVGGFGYRRGGPGDWGAFKFFSHDIQQNLPPYPYKDPSVNAQAKALNAINLAEARTALR